MIARRLGNGRDIIECSICRDGDTLAGTDEQRDAEAAAFGYRHRHVNSELPPSIERAARGKR